ncbi:MAG: YIP1 family protein [Anaerolineales bacterium]|nr:YIP1 family protein [Anaerolineales bacterium]
MEQIPSNTPIMESKPGPAGWLPVWIKAVTKPNEQTFVDITEHPDMNARTAYIWVFIAGTISGILQAIATTIRLATGMNSQFQQIPGLEQYFPQSTGGAGSAGVSLITGLCVSPIAGLISVVVFALFVAIIQWIAKLFGGTGTYEKLLYAIAAISVPFTLVSSLLAIFAVIPYVGACFGILSFGLSIYALVLQVMAVKGVNRFGWGPAIGSVFIPIVIILITCACVFFGAFMLLSSQNFAL